MFDVLAAQLNTLRAQVGGFQSQIDTMQLIVDDLMTGQLAAVERPCPHDDVRDLSTLGHPQKQCRRCGQWLAGGPDA